MAKTRASRRGYVARECVECAFNDDAGRHCVQFDRQTPPGLTAREHDPGRCWTAKKKETSDGTDAAR